MALQEALETAAQMMRVIPMGPPEVLGEVARRMKENHTALREAPVGSVRTRAIRTAQLVVPATGPREDMETNLATIASTSPRATIIKYQSMKT